MASSPLVLCLTNHVASNFTANCLLAVGAKPAMVEDSSEAAELAGIADAVLINLGTVTAAQAEAMRAAIACAKRKGTPWVLDPVGVQCLRYRRELAREFLAQRPTLVRGNRTEIEFIGPIDVPSLATGAEDVVSSPQSQFPVTISGGTPLLQLVTATGCAQGALCAAFLGWGQAPEKAAISASKLMKKAGNIAQSRAQAPGSFQIALLDAIFELADQFR